jgi:serine/threonine protein kinase
MAQTDFSPTTADVQEVLPSASIEQQIGSGGQKIVYKAEFKPYGTVALKLIKPGPGTKERTMRELDAASNLSGPHFAKIYEIGDVKIKGEDVIYIIEEFLTGETLRSRLQREQHLSEKATMMIGEQLLEALIAVESAGLVHRDVKPENIIILSDGRVILLDFGIARHLKLPSLTADIALFGPMTVGYAAPEQVKNEKRKICNRTDLFAWATVMYECITGQNPFILGSSHQGETLRKTLAYDPPILSGIKGDIAQLIQDCLRKVVHRRPPSAAAILKALRNIGGS